MTEASWLGPNATPYQAVGPSAQKRPHENGKCPPHLKVQRALQEAGSDETSTYRTAEQLSRLFPLRITTITSFLPGAGSVPRRATKLCHADHCPGEQLEGVSVTSVYTHIQLWGWFQTTKEPFSPGSPAMFSISLILFPLGHCLMDD